MLSWVAYKLRLPFGATPKLGPVNFPLLTSLWLVFNYTPLPYHIFLLALERKHELSPHFHTSTYLFLLIPVLTLFLSYHWFLCLLWLLFFFIFCGSSNSLPSVVLLSFGGIPPLLFSMTALLSLVYFLFFVFNYHLSLCLLWFLFIFFVSSFFDFCLFSSWTLLLYVLLLHFCVFSNSFSCSLLILLHLF